MQNELKTADFSYNLPEERIAKYPLAQRDASKLLVYKNEEIRHSLFADLHEQLPPKSLLVFNNTRVVQARLLFTKTEGAKPIEIFCLEPFHLDVEQAMAAKKNVQFVCLVGNAKRWNEGLLLQQNISLSGQSIILKAHKISREADTFCIEFTWEGDFTFSEILEAAGKVPLPPYLKRASEAADKERYQTVYARQNGSVAAPTAGLHFTEAVFEKLKLRDVKIAETTLHVGAGTFKPVSAEDARNHDMHAEEIHLKSDFLEMLLQHDGPIISVGTTSTRTLESLYWLGVKFLQNQQLEQLELSQWEANLLPQDVSMKEAISALKTFVDAKGGHYFTHTQIMIVPGYTCRVINALLTNFHQPGSTLILLVSALIGPAWRKVYAEALANEYRFLSYGDSSLLFVSHR